MKLADEKNYITQLGEVKNNLAESFCEIDEGIKTLKILVGSGMLNPL